MPRTIHGERHGEGLRIAVLVSTWNAVVTDRLRAGALDVLVASGVADAHITVVEVPGAFELPQAAAAVVARGLTGAAPFDAPFDAIVALGCLVKGETDHDQYIAQACAHGLMEVSIAAKIPVTFGVITAKTTEQAHERSRDGAAGKGGHKGREAAEAAVRLASAFKVLRRATP